MAQHSKARTKAEAQFKQVQKPQPATQPTTEGGQDKSTSGVDTSEAEGGKVADASPSGYSGEGRARNRFLKLIRTTGTRFSRIKRGGNSAAFFASITAAQGL